MAMKKQLIPCALLSACLMLGAGAAAMAETPAAGPKLVAHYTFADETNVGKDSAGTQDLIVQGATVGSAGTAKQVEGPANMKALEFDQTYSLMSDADDVLDDMKEFTITYLVSANDAEVLRSNVFSTGAANGNSFKNSGLNHLIDKTNGIPDFRLFGGNQEDSAQADGSKWDANQRKNDDGKNGKNFIKTMLNVGKTYDTVRVVSDQVGTPTYTYDLARLLVDMAESEKYGYYHATNEGGYISWYDFTCEIYKQAGYTTKVVPVTTEEYGLSKAARPYNSRLDKSKLVEAGFTPLPTWQDALGRYLKEIEY